jgi:hypothetical protein
VVERAAQFLADDQPFREVSVIVGAVRADCEEFVSATRQNYVLAGDFALDHAAIG